MEKELDSIAILVKMETPLLSGSYQIEVIGFRKRFSKTKYAPELCRVGKTCELFFYKEPEKNPSKTTDS